VDQPSGPAGPGAVLRLPGGDPVNDLNATLLRDFARSLRARNLSPRTIQSYQEAAGQLAAHLDRPLPDATRGDIEDYLSAVLARHSAPTAANRYRSLQQLFKWLGTEDEIDRDPMAGMRPPAVQEQPVPILSDDQVTRLLKVCEGREFEDRRDTAIVRLMLEPGGLRLSEVTNLAVADLDLDVDVVRVLGKGRRVRSVPFGAKTGQALSRYVRARARHPLALNPALWLGGRGMALTTSGVTQLLRRRAAAAGIEHLHPHQLRHTAAHLWLASGGTEGDAMRLFGWRSRQMLGRYGSSAADQRAHDAARAAALGDRW